MSLCHGVGHGQTLELTAIITKTRADVNGSSNDFFLNGLNENCKFK